MEFQGETVQDDLPFPLWPVEHAWHTPQEVKAVTPESSKMCESFHWESMEPTRECVVDILNQKIILPLWDISTNKQAN